MSKVYREGERFPVKLDAAVVAPSGGLVLIGTDGLAQGAAAADQICLGVWDEAVDTTGLPAGTTALCQRGQHYLLKNDLADPLVQADLGMPVYASGLDTVARTDGGGTRSQAGRFMGFDVQNPSKVWVEIK